MEKLLKIYMLGFGECPDGKSSLENYSDPKERRAYQLGWDHYIIGDDVRSVDYLTDSEILHIINAPLA